MRRIAVAFLIVVASSVSAGCSLFNNDNPAPAVQSGADSGPSRHSRTFDTAFPISGANWDATIALSNLRIISSYVYSDAVVVVDVRAVQAAGQPEIDPAYIKAFDSDGNEYERIAYPKGTVPDPLVRTVLQSPGQEVRGMVAWTMPRGQRIGRIDVDTPTSISSITVPKQPVDPMVSAPPSTR